MASARATDDAGALALRLRGRDADAFERLYDRYSGLVHGIALRVLLDPVTAEDVTQATFLKVWSNPEAFRGGAFAAWLARVARNCAIDALRRRTAGGSRGEVPAFVAAATDDVVLAEIESAQVHRALARLPLECRELIEMGFFLDISHREIARLTALPLGTVKSRIRAGLQRLRRELTPQLSAGRDTGSATSFRATPTAAGSEASGATGSRARPDRA